MYTTLISVQQLKDLQTSGKAFMVFDCTGDLMKPEMADTLFTTVRLKGAMHRLSMAADIPCPRVRQWPLG